MAQQKQQMAYYMTEEAYLTPTPATMPVPPPKTVQSPQPPQQWTGYQTHKGYYPNKRQRKRGSSRDYCGNHHQQYWGHIPNTHYQHPAGNQGGQQSGANTEYSNIHKTFPKIEYCYSCGYDMDHNGPQCQWQKQGHITNTKMDEEHMCPGACMVAQNKTLPNRTGEGKGWILYKSVTKEKVCHEQVVEQP